MILCCGNAVPLLFEQAYLERSNHDLAPKFDPRELLFFDFYVDDLSTRVTSRNRLLVIRNGLTDFLLKQPRTFTRESILTVKKEALFSKLIRKRPKLTKHFLGNFGYDETNAIFFREWLEDAKPICEFIKKGAKPDESKLRKLGQCLRDFHKELHWPVPELKPLEPFFATNFPSPLFTFEKDLKGYYDLALDQESLLYVNYLMHDSKQQIVDAIQTLRKVWSDNANVVIHGDIKFDNILSNSKGDIYLIDWELAMIADPAWDLSGILYGLFVVLFSHLMPTRSFDEIVMWMKPVLDGYWDSFENSADMKDSKIRIVAYSGIRIVEYFIKNKPRFVAETILQKFGELMILNPSLLASSI